MAVDEVMKRAVCRLVGSEEAISAIAGVDQVMFTGRFSSCSIRQRVAPDAITEAYQVSAGRFRRQELLGFLPRDEA